MAPPLPSGAAPTAAPDPLAGLKDWHLPDPPSWWPPAPGWWVLAALAAILVLLAVRRWLAYRREGAPARAALRELARLRARLGEDGDVRGFAAAVSGLLRRLALVRYPREQVAGLAGAEWIAFLDRSGGAGGFAAGAGRALADLPYRPNGPVSPPSGPEGDPGPAVPEGAPAIRPDPSELAVLAGRWIRANGGRAP